MQSNNPIFRNSEEFGGRRRGQQAYASGPGGPGWDAGAPGQIGGMPVQEREATGGPMTIDSVVQKSAIAFGTVLVTAFVTWFLTPDLERGTGIAGSLLAAAMIGSLVAFGLSMVNSFKRVVSPGLVLAFCAAEGVALGALSKVFDAWFGGSIVVNAVLGTFAAFAGTLAVYKFFNIQVGQKFRTFVIAAVFGMIALSLMEVVLQLFGAGIGIFGFGTMGLLFSLAGLVLGIFMLILDFDFVEKGVAWGIPERESWRAAFALTVSLVWIYTNLLRLLAIFGDN